NGTVPVANLTAAGRIVVPTWRCHDRSRLAEGSARVKAPEAMSGAPNTGNPACMSLIIIGAGPNLGQAVAPRFGRGGFAVCLVSRTQSKLDDLASQLSGDGITAKGAAADIRDHQALSAAIESLAAELGPVEVLEYSPLPAREFMKPILETTVDDI